jgi:hypothetical protein
MSFDKKLNMDTATSAEIKNTSAELVDYLEERGEVIAAEHTQFLIDGQANKKSEDNKEDPNTGKLLKVNKAILEKLSSIYEDMNDEQDTSISKAQQNKWKGFDKKESVSKTIEKKGSSVPTIIFMGGGGGFDFDKKKKPPKPTPTSKKPPKPGSPKPRGPKPNIPKTSGLGGFAKGAARLAGPALAVGMGIWQASEAIDSAEERKVFAEQQAMESLNAGEITKSEYDLIVEKAENTQTMETSTGVGEAAGGTSGALAGAAAGAAIGSVVPVVGTIVGSIVGGTIGYFAGSKAGKSFGENVGEGINAEKIADKYPGIVDFDGWGRDSDIEDWDKLSKLKSNQIQEIISMDDWSDKDKKRLIAAKERAQISEKLSKDDNLSDVEKTINESEIIERNDARITQLENTKKLLLEKYNLSDSQAEKDAIAKNIDALFKAKEALLMQNSSFESNASTSKNTTSGVIRRTSDLQTDEGGSDNNETQMEPLEIEVMKGVKEELSYQNNQNLINSQVAYDTGVTRVAIAPTVAQQQVSINSTNTQAASSDRALTAFS